MRACIIALSSLAADMKRTPYAADPPRFVTTQGNPMNSFLLDPAVSVISLPLIAFVVLMAAGRAGQE